MNAVDDTTLRRIRMRSMRRGIKEMDLILSAYADDRLAELPVETVALYEEMLFENDQELYTWVSGQVAAPDRFATLVEDICQHMAQHVQKNGPS